jgi:hypothetical protein
MLKSQSSRKSLVPYPSLGSDTYGTAVEIMANLVSLLLRNTSTITLFQDQAISKELGQGRYGTLPGWASI